MIIIENKTYEESHGPENITVDNVQHWSRHSMELAKSQVSKALKFVKYDCIKYIGNNLDNLPEQNNLREHYPDAKHLFICLPLNSETEFNFFGLTLTKREFTNDYNNSEYIIYKRLDNTFLCNCQANVTKRKKGEFIIGGANCSHVLGLFYMFKMKRFTNGQGADDSLIQADMVKSE